MPSLHQACPFGGTGTTAMVARALGRYGVSCDLSGDYQRLAKWRIWQSGQAARVAAKTDGERQGDLFGGTAFEALCAGFEEEM